MESISIRVLLADDEAAIRNGLQNAIPWEQYHAKVVAVAVSYTHLTLPTKA